MFAKKVVSGPPPEKRQRLSKEEFNALKERLSARKKILQNFPLFKLIMAGQTASLASPKDSRVPLMIKDVQDLIIDSVVGEVRHLNRWFILSQQQKISQTIVLVVDNASVNDIEENQDLFPKTLELFDSGIEMMNPNSGGLSISVALAYSPIINSLKRNIPKVYRSLKEALDDGHVHSVTDFTEQSYQGKETTTSNGENQKEKLVENDKGCTKSQLMLSALQLITGSFPYPGQGRPQQYRFTKDKYEPVTDNSPMFAIDCEWCLCVDGTYGLARVGIVDENLRSVYHAYVLPDKSIRDYVTKWSGITPQILKRVQKRLYQVQDDIRKLLPPDAILVGHSLRGDLVALEMFHPYIIDTSVIFNMTGCRVMKSKLKFLSKLFCDRSIQLSDKGHDPNEDALATMELALLKLKHGLNYGDLSRNPGGYSNGPSKEKILAVMSDSIFGTTSSRGEESLDLQDVLLMKFFALVQSVNVSAILITDPAYDKIYRPKSPIHRGLFKCETDPIRKRESDPVKIVHQPELQCIATTLEFEPRTDLVFIHTAVAKEEKDKGHLTKLDQLIADLHTRMPMSGMMIVVFGGKANPLENGVCMANVKKPRKEDL